MQGKSRRWAAGTQSCRDIALRCHAASQRRNVWTMREKPQVPPARRKRSVAAYLSGNSLRMNRQFLARPPVGTRAATSRAAAAQRLDDIHAERRTGSACHSRGPPQRGGYPSEILHELRQFWRGRARTRAVMSRHEAAPLTIFTREAHSRPLLRGDRAARHPPRRKLRIELRQLWRVSVRTSRWMSPRAAAQRLAYSRQRTGSAHIVGRPQRGRPHCRKFSHEQDSSCARHVVGTSCCDVRAEVAAAQRLTIFTRRRAGSARLAASSGALPVLS
jgi:hypothetical protein